MKGPSFSLASIRDNTMGTKDDFDPLSEPFLVYSGDRPAETGLQTLPTLLSSAVRHFRRARFFSFLFACFFLLLGFCLLS